MHRNAFWSIILLTFNRTAKHFWTTSNRGCAHFIGTYSRFVFTNSIQKRWRADAHLRWTRAKRRHCDDQRQRHHVSERTRPNHRLTAVCVGQQRGDRSADRLLQLEVEALGASFAKGSVGGFLVLTPLNTRRD